MTENNHSIIVENLTKKFGDFTAVNNITFTVDKGEIFGFLGANGAGKTTAIKMLCGLLLPTSGKAWISGYDIYKQGKEIRQNIGYMSQKFSLYEDLTAKENMELFGTIYGLKRNTLKKRIEEIIAELKMEKLANKLVVSLPIGHKQKLSFATALIHSPEIVFLDEPTSGVDPIVRREFWEMIYATAAKGVAIFVTTHYMDEAEYCNRVCIMSAGEIKIMGNPRLLKQQLGVKTMDEVFYKIVNK